MNTSEIFESMEYGPAPESAAEALQWIKDHSSDGKFDLFIDGGWLKRPQNTELDTINPATGETLARITVATAADASLAVRAAKAALDRWQTIGPHGRARYLYALARLIQKHSRLLAVLETLDNGKPIRESRDIDIPLAARHFYHHAGWAQVLDTEFPGYTAAGVAAQIIPWNFPLLMLAWKAAPALAAGCTIVLKPAENTSLTALAFAHLCTEAGLPQGVVNIITGDGSTGEALTKIQGISKIAFTGSTEVGRAIRKSTAGTNVKLTLELGGKSPFIVFEDADLDSAVEGLVDSIWFNQGQVCCAGSRLLVQESIQERFLTKVRSRMEKIRVGDPLDKTVDMGAIVSEVQRQRIQSLVAAAESEGAEVWQASSKCPTTGCFYPPTLITGTGMTSAVMQEEIFGPVLTAISFRTPAEAAEIANNTRYGLAASIWTESISLALDIAPKIKAGTVWINSANLFDAGSGFGGYRESGFGREGGREGMWEYLVPAQTAAGYSAEYLLECAEEEEDGDPEPEVARIPAPIPSSALDRTAKLYIGGKQARPDSGYSLPVISPEGYEIGLVGAGSRKDIRNAVEAARAALPGWAGATAHLRAQILYYIAENLEVRAAEFAERISVQTGRTQDDAANEVALSIERLFIWAALADKVDGAVHSTPGRQATLAMVEPVGIIGIGCAWEHPLLGLISAAAPAIALGNTVVLVPSEKHPLSATDLYQVLDTSDLPAGVLNIVTGPREALIQTLASHDEVNAVWYWGTQTGVKSVHELSAANLKRTWTNGVSNDAWLSAGATALERFKHEATQIKNIWIPYGV
jgi:aldehyde dehydrogenase (NAD+)